MPKHNHPPHQRGHHPPPPPHHRGHHPPPPPHHMWENPLPAEEDFEVLEALLQDSDLANAVWRSWREESPWEVAAVGAIVLRAFGALMRAFPDQLSPVLQEGMAGGDDGDSQRKGNVQ